MSEPVAKQRPMIDLDEFERRLRRPVPGQASRQEDPLAELARLVGDGKDPYQNMFQEKPATPRRPTTAAERIAVRAERLGTPELGFRSEIRRELPRAAPVASILAHDTVTRSFPQIEPSFEEWSGEAATSQKVEPAANGVSRGRLGGSFAAIEAGLRGSIQPEFPAASPKDAPSFSHHPDLRQRPRYEAPALEEDENDWLDETQMAVHAAAEPAPEAPRSRRLLYVTAGIILIGMGGIGATFAIKRSVPAPRQIAMIKASTSPTKVAPPKPAAGEGAKIIQDASVLDKTPQPMPTAVVNRAEQPVNVAQTASLAAKAPAPQAAGAATVPVPPPPTPAAAPDSSVSLSEPWQQSASKPAQVADAAPNQAFGLGGVIQPKKVKTVSVRPDGTIISDDAPTVPPPAAAAASPTTATAANEVAAAKPPKDVKPKSDVRAAPAGAGAAERQALVAGRAEAVTPKTAMRAKPMRVAEVEADKHEGAAAGTTFAVQLAAPATQAEALRAIGRLERRFAGELNGRPLKWHHAKVGNKSVYRVRAGGLTKAEAVKLCEALQAKGGSCFVGQD